MPHVIEVVENMPFNPALKLLREAHTFLANRVVSAQNQISNDIDNWGIRTKRLMVDLRGGPELIGKPSEKFVELINILATTERTLEAMDWLAKHNSDLVVSQCHASTSDFEGGNDIVLKDGHGKVRVRCEVCDVVSNRAGQNKKEESDLKVLGCAEKVPNDGVDRYVATSKEFAAALVNPKRRWSHKHYRYEIRPTGLPLKTVMLELKLSIT